MGPLQGRRIVVTRAREQAGKLVHALRDLGSVVVELPLVEVVAPASYAPLDAALRNAASYQWLIVTSANTALAIDKRLKFLGLDASTLSHLKTVAIGPATAEALKAVGMDVSVAPGQYVAESLVQELRGKLNGERVLLARAAVARDVIPDAIRAAGATVDVVEAYRNILPADAPQQVKELLSPGAEPLDAVTFTSSSTVERFFQLLQEAGVAKPQKPVAALSIGPVTSQTLREHGWEPATEAAPHDIQGLVDATVRFFSR